MHLFKIYLGNITIEIKNNKNCLINTLVINSPVRSGQKIYARNRDLIATTNISVGAELIADGNIHVYGIMRGRVLAGALGDINCQIFCTHLYPELIAIAGKYLLIDKIPTYLLGNAARISLQKGILTIKPLI